MRRSPEPIPGGTHRPFPALEFEFRPMLTELFPFLDPGQNRGDLARRLRALADDCSRLALGHPVPPAMLQKAPLLEDWIPAVTPKGVRLIGRATGHPIHGDRQVMTAPLWFADPDGAWIRTLLRFYRLGPPADPCNISRILAASHARVAVDADNSSEGEA
jgi:hypothetical protein